MNVRVYRRKHEEDKQSYYIGKRPVSHTKIHSVQFGKSVNESLEHGTTVRMARTKINETHAESGEGNRLRWKIENGKVLLFGFRL
jgi:hypothetical protein